MLNEIKNYLISNGLESDTTCFKGLMPASPDNATCLYETAGFEANMTFDGQNIEYPSLQVICRGTDYDETRERINNIFKKLHGNSDIFFNMIAQQSPVSLGQDGSQRWQFSVNFKIIKMI